MAGHSKWKTIKHKKAKEDAKRGKEFTKIIKEITVAARDGGGDPGNNPKLRTLLEKSKEINMPIDNAKRAIKKGTGELPGQSYEAVMYEGYGPAGIAVMVDTLTDNKNRTVAELRHLFTKKGGNLAEGGAVSWMFEKLGVVRASGGTLSEDELLEELLDFDVQDINKYDDVFEVVCASTSLDIVKNKINDLGCKVENAELEWVPKNSTEVTNDQVENAVALLDALEEHEDVQNVYANLAN